MCSFLCYAIHCVISRFAFSLMGKKGTNWLTLIVVLVSFDCYCHLVLQHDSVGLQCVVVVFPEHTHF